MVPNVASKAGVHRYAVVGGLPMFRLVGQSKLYRLTEKLR